MERAIDKFDQYVDGVIDGSIVASKWIVKACERHIKDIKRSKSGDLPYIFDRKKADQAISVFPVLFRHTVGKYAGTPFVLAPWQAFIIGMLFGWRGDNGTRRFRRAYVTLARKQGKSTLAAGIAILLATMDGEEQSQVFVAATKVDQAKVVFGEAQRMIQRSPYLKQMADSKVAVINFPKSNSYIKPLGTDRAFDGLNPHGVILDEIHAWKEVHRAFHDTITTGSASRSQPLEFTITTAGDNKSMLWKELDSYCVGVLDGTMADETQFAFVARLDDKSEMFDESAWPKAQPNLGISVDIDYVRDLAKKAKVSPIEEKKFARYMCNVEVTSSSKLVDIEDWDECRGELSNWNEAGAICTAIDAGGLADIMASYDVAKFADGFDEKGNQEWRYEVKGRCYIDSDTARDLSEEPWGTWLYTDKIKQVASLYQSCFVDTVEAMLEFGTQRIGFDPFNMQQMGERFVEEGFEAIRISQSRFNMHEPLTLLIELINKGKIRHNGDPVLRWAIENLVVNTDSNNRWMPDRKNSKDKIDPAVAVIMALRLCSLTKPGPQGGFFVT